MPTTINVPGLGRVTYASGERIPAKHKKHLPGQAEAASSTAASKRRRKAAPKPADDSPATEA